MAFNPTEIVCDFEKAIHLGAKKAWPQIKVIGCRFHLAQAWFRKIQSLGLVSHYRQRDSTIGQWLRWSFGLMYLNPNEVDDCFVEDLYSIIPQDQNVIHYADYLVDNYLSEDAFFNPQLWAYCSSSLEHTTNACEAFHRTFNSFFYVPHPDIYRFVSVLQEIQLHTYIKLNSIGLLRRPVNKKQKDKMNRVSDCISLYEKKHISRFDFVRHVCHNFTT